MQTCSADLFEKTKDNGSLSDAFHHHARQKAFRNMSGRLDTAWLDMLLQVSSACAIFLYVSHPQ